MQDRLGHDGSRRPTATVRRGGGGARKRDVGWRFAGAGKLAATLLIGLTMVSGCRSDPGDRLDEIRALHAQGALSEVLAELAPILSDQPDHAEANFMLGQVLLQTARPKPALEALKKAARDPRYARPAGLLAASTSFDLRDYEGAIEAANAVLAVDSSSSVALLTRGRSHLAVGRAEAALADADSILSRDPNHQNATLLKGHALIALGRTDEAEKAWLNLHTRLRGLGRTQEAGRACVQLALFYRSRGDLDATDRTYQKCLAAYPSHAYLQRWASDHFIRQGETDRAVELHRDAVAAAPDDLRLRARLANVLLAAGEPEQAEAALDEAVEQFDSAEAWRILADFRLRRGRSDLAIAALEQAITRSRQPDQPALFSLADLLVGRGDVERARSLGSSLTEPSYQRLLDGIIRLHEGEPEAALEHLDEALELWPQNARAHYLAGEAAARSGDRARAVAEYRSALELNDRETDAALRLAEIEFGLGRPKRALRYARRHIVRRPFSDPAAFQIAIRSAVAIGQVELATQLSDAFARALDADDGEDGAETALWLIERAAVERARGGRASAIDFILSKQRDLSDPEHERLLRILAEDLRDENRTGEGLELVEAAIARSPENPRLFDLRSRLLFSLGRLAEADAAADRALALDASHAPAFEAKAYIALERSDAMAAIRLLETAAQSAPENADYLRRAASIARDHGDRERAITYLEQALERSPGYGSAANDLAWLLALEGRDLDRALTLARTAATRINSAAALETLGFVRHQRGELSLAVTSFRSALERNPNLPAVHYRLGVSLAALGEKEEAREIFENLLEGPAFPERDEARSALARLDES